MQKKIKPAFVSLILLLMALITNQVQAGNQWQLNWHKTHGINVKYRGLLLNRGFQFVCASPDFKKHYFYGPKTPYNIYKDHQSLTINSKPGANPVFALQEQSAVVTGANQLTFIAKGRLKQDIPVTIQNIVLFIPDFILNDATVIADDKVFTIGDKPADLKKAAKKFVIKSRYGSMTIVVKKGAALRIQDRRKRMYGRKKGFLFICSVKLKKAQLYEQVTELTIGADFKINIKLPEYNKKNQITWYDTPSDKIKTSTEIYPIPKSIAIKKSVLELTEKSNIEINGTNQAEETKLFNALHRVLMRTRCDTQLTAGAEKSQFVININPEIARKDKYDYYELKIDKQVIINAATPAGAFYALQTLAQLMRGRTVRCAEITDYADMKIRAIMLASVDKNLLKFAVPFIEELYAPLKINTIFIYAQRINLKALPELNSADNLTPEQVGKLDEVCQNNFISLNPILSTYGHMEWLLKNPAYRDLAEDPDHPYAYNVSNPRTYKVMTKILDNLLAIFPHLKYLHLGHDEVDFRARYPFRKENMKTPIWKLYLKNLRFCEAYAQRHNVKLMVWENKPVGANENRSPFVRAWREFSKKTVVAVWDYHTYKEFPDAAYFKKLGNPTLGATGTNPNDRYEDALLNLKNYSQYAEKIGLDGMIQTTWSGTARTIFALFKYSDQFINHAEAACIFWNTSYTPTPYHQTAGRYTRSCLENAMRRIYPELYQIKNGVKSYYLDLADNFNTLFYNDNGNSTPLWNKKTMRGLNGIRFKVGFSNKPLKPLAVSISKNSPLVLTLRTSTDAISLLWATLGGQSLMKKVGSLVIRTDSGEKKITLRVGREILPTAVQFKPRVTVSEILSPNKRFNLSQYTLKLPANARSVTISASGYNNILLLAATGITGKRAVK
jgi:hypothetical protein